MLSGGKSCWKDSIIAQNEMGKYYFISIGLFGLDYHIHGNNKTVVVMPGTPEHEELTELIKTEDDTIIEKYAQILAIKYLSPEYVYDMIEKVKQQKFKQGRRDAQTKMLEALGIIESNYLMRDRN